MKLVGWLLTFGVAMSAGAHAQMSLEEAVNAEHRPAAHRARDGYRHPVDTISFFGTKPTDKVLEIWPGDGWYTEILAPYLKEQGKYTAAVYPLNKINSKDKQEAYRSKKSREFVDRFSDKDVYGKVKFVDYGTGPQKAKFKANYYDAVYAIRIVHVWDEVGRLSKGFIDAYKALKPGGVLAIVAHRSNDMADGVSQSVEGYLAESYVIAAAQNAGFEFVAKSDINANPKDTKDYPKGVYALPPTLAMGNTDRERYVAIGESDRMTLKFRKPI